MINEDQNMSAYVIETRELTKTYVMGDVKVHALRGIDLNVEPGEFLAIMGSSGSGKSTLMNMLGCLDQPTTGEFFIDGLLVTTLQKSDCADIRNQKIGFVFQVFNLLARTTALENVQLPLMYDRHNRITNHRAAAQQALEQVGLGNRLDHEPSQLSGGQQQRVAIARSLVNQPSIILADEPTGNLDTRTSIEVMSVFQELNEQGITVILVTHEPEIALYAKRVIEMRDGRIRRDYNIKNRRNARDDLTQTSDDHEVCDNLIQAESISLQEYGT